MSKIAKQIYSSATNNKTLSVAKPRLLYYGMTGLFVVVVALLFYQSVTWSIYDPSDNADFEKPTQYIFYHNRYLHAALCILSLVYGVDTSDHHNVPWLCALHEIKYYLLWATLPITLVIVPSLIYTYILQSHGNYFHGLAQLVSIPFWSQNALPGLFIGHLLLGIPQLKRHQHSLPAPPIGEYTAPTILTALYSLLAYISFAKPAFTLSTFTSLFTTLPNWRLIGLFVFYEFLVLSACNVLSSIMLRISGKSN
ncbi:hypothetical protein NEHOM01_0574 [Nematocida homosporus]|uniref:uncharacterized protein n=1 Tax=Nematocida homosporus TaxID=1912981 RepID=UPI00221EF2BA|nr:uncharacterized protein NEHOM01_0574 [Nematocida homosporus]KAI5185069.1 hypothetical protein NEHOM01_0574 [Nematocida homosporus]